MNTKGIYIQAASAISAIDSFDQAKLDWRVDSQGNNFFLCKDVDYKAYIPVRMLRRMSKPVKMGVALTEQILQSLELEKPDAIIMGTGLGLARDTERFLNEMIEEKEELLAPTAFIQSIHNTLGGQIAMAKKCHGYNMTYVQDNVSFEAALLDALCYVRENEGEKVLCGGFDELTDQSYKLYEYTGDWRSDAPHSDDILQHKANGRVAGEGAAAFLLSSEPARAGSTEVLDVYFEMNQEAQSKDLIVPFLNRNGLEVEDVDVCILGVDGDEDGDQCYDAFIEACGVSCALAYKHLSGHYYAASSFALWLADYLLKTQTIPAALLYKGVSPGRFKYVLIYQKSGDYANHGMILVRR